MKERGSEPSTRPRDAPDPGPGTDTAGSPGPGPLRRLLECMSGRVWEDHILNASAAAAFWQTLSLPPLLLGLFGILGYVGDWFGPDTVTAVQQWIIGATSGVFSRDVVEEIIAPTVADVLTTARGEVISFGFLLSFWSGSAAMSAFVDAITLAHRQHPVRHVVWQRTLAVLLYLVSLAIGIVLLPIVALPPGRLLPLLPDAWTPAVDAVATGTYPMLVGFLLVLALTTLYKIAPPHKMPWYRGLPGALLAVVVFLAGITGLRFYLDWVTRTGYTYGALAAPIAFLLATFFIALAIILGAYLNAAIQVVWTVPMRRRGRPVEPVFDHEPSVDLSRAVHRDPEAAAVALEQLGYAVTGPPAAGDRT